MDAEHGSETTAPSPRPPSELAWLASAAFLALVVLLSMMVDGTFTNDEGHYTLTILGLREGTFRWEATRGLMDSKELLLPAMQLPQTPIAPQQPPLYAFLALPFSYLGWPWLIGLNVVAFVATGAMVHRLAARASGLRRTPWIALAIYWLACFSLEYALGMWPHCVAVALTTAGLGALLVGRDRLVEGRRRAGGVWAVAAGLLFGLATGVRYQEAVFAALAVAGTLACLPWGRSRVSSVASEPAPGENADAARPSPEKPSALTAGVLVLGLTLGSVGPLAAMSAINHARLGSWNPVSKGRGYTDVRQPWSATRTRDAEASKLPVAVSGLLFRVFDYAQKPAGTKRASTRATGEPLVYAGVVKKALLQSAPWMVWPLGMFLGAWWPRRHRTSAPPTDEGDVPIAARRRSDLRTFAAIVIGVLGLFSVVGAARTSGFCFNMRYFLELMPLGAVAIAWALESMEWRPRELAVGGALGGGLAALAAWQCWEGEYDGVLYLPLLVAAAIAVTALLRGGARRWAPVALAAGLGWAMLMHGLEDTRVSLTVRANHGHYRDVVASWLTDQPTALYAYRGNNTPFYPLQLDHRLIFVDPFMDGGETARPLMDQLLARGDRVLVLPERMPGPLTQQILGGRLVRRLAEDELIILEVEPVPPPLR